MIGNLCFARMLFPSLPPPMLELAVLVLSVILNSLQQSHVVRLMAFAPKLARKMILSARHLPEAERASYVARGIDVHTADLLYAANPYKEQAKGLIPVTDAIRQLWRAT